MIGRYHSAGTFDGVVVVRRGGKQIYARAVGLGNRATNIPLRPDDVFPLASLTKQLTASLVVREVVAGHLNLDAKARDYIAISSDVTLRELLQHTSGLPDPEAGTPDGQMPAYLTRPVTELGSDLVEAQRCEQGTPLARGEFHYNNCDYIILGAVLSTVAHRSFDQLVGELIAPLQLRTFGMFTAKENVTIAPIAYDMKGSPQPTLTFAAFGAAGALYGSIEDAARWGDALLHHEVLDARVTDLMFTPAKDLHGEALGSWVYTLDDIRLIERQGSAAGYQTLLLVSPTLDATIAIEATNETASLFELWSKKGLPYDLVKALAVTREDP